MGYIKGLDLSCRVAVNAELPTILLARLRAHDSALAGWSPAFSNSRSGATTTGLDSADGVDYRNGDGQHFCLRLERTTGQSIHD
jgi:hypothetical protein